MKTIELKISEVVANHATNLRKDYGNEDFASLKESIKQHGILQPMHVYKGDDNKYHLFDGFRRHKAVYELLEEGIIKDTKLVFVINDIEDEATRILKTLLSNERKNFTAIEESLMIGELVELTGKSQAQVAEMLGKTPAYVSKAMSISRADESVVNAAKSGAINVNDAAALSRTSQAVQQQAITAINEKPDKKDAIVKAVVDTKKNVTNTPKPTPKPANDDDEEVNVVNIPDEADDIDIDDAISAAIVQAQTQAKPMPQPRPATVADTEPQKPTETTTVKSDDFFPFVLKVMAIANNKKDDSTTRVIRHLINFHKIGGTPESCYNSLSEIINTGF
jgi:ParB family chromosome partitioning protein